jgi:hypothetical protein
MDCYDCRLNYKSAPISLSTKKNHRNINDNNNSNNNNNNTNNNNNNKKSKNNNNNNDFFDNQKDLFLIILNSRLAIPQESLGRFCEGNWLDDQCINRLSCFAHYGPRTILYWSYDFQFSPLTGRDRFE